jgi:HSP20 family protein
VAILQDRINRLFSESFGQTRDLDDDMRVCAWRPAVDIYEAENEIVLKAELPGITKEDVSVEVKDNALINEDKYYRREICFGTFERTFTLQDRIQPEQIKATFKDGILTVKIPRPQAETPKQITVDVE